MANQVDGQSVGRMAAVTPVDTAVLEPTIGLCCAVDGTAAVVCVGNTAPVTIQMTAGVLYPIRAKRVYSTGTTATGIVALYQS